MKRIVGTYTPEGLGNFFNYARDTGSYNIPAGVAILVPFVLSRNGLFRQAIVMPAKTIPSEPFTKFDVGVYTEAGNLIRSLGPTEKVNMYYSCQISNFDSSIALQANTPYYLAFVTDSSTSLYEMLPWNSTAKNQAIGVRIAENAFPLPAHVTPLKATGQNIPLVGLSGGPSIM